MSQDEREAARQRSRAARAKARSEGKCSTCKRRPARPNRSTCEKCASDTQKGSLFVSRSQRVHNRPRMALKRPHRVQPPLAIRAFTRLRAASHGTDVTRERRIKANQCLTSGCEGTAIDHRHCKACRAENSAAATARFDERIAAGLCRCGKARVKVKGESCAACKRKRRARRAKSKRDVVIAVNRRNRRP